MKSVELSVNPKDFESVRCICCDTIGQWQNVDEFRYKPSQMHMCRTCGFITYPDVIMNGEKLKEHYKEEYRPAPGVNNLFSSERKLHYHVQFLDDLFKEWDQKQKKNPNILEIGAAIGLFLNFARGRYPKGSVYGTELTKSFVRCAFWIYKLKLEPDADWTKKYDLIMSYKVAEHQPDIDVQLRKYREALTKDGRLYISVPTWFKTLSNFGSQGFSLEYYYDKNHVNVWSRNLFERLLMRSGFTIVKENHSMYDDSYLCKVETPAEVPALDDPAKRLEELKKIFEAAKAFDEGKYSQAIGAWNNFPEAHSHFYEMNRAKAHQEGWDHILKNHIERALEACPDNPNITLFAGDIHMRYDKWDEAIQLFDKTLQLRPYDVQALMAIGNCLRARSKAAPNPHAQIKLRHDAMNLTRVVEKNSLQSRYDAINWAMSDAAEIPTPFESGYDGLFEMIKDDETAAS